MAVWNRARSCTGTSAPFCGWNSFCRILGTRAGDWLASRDSPRCTVTAFDRDLLPSLQVINLEEGEVRPQLAISQLGAALGANSSAVLKNIVVRGLRPVFAGMSVGLAAAAAISTMLHVMLVDAEWLTCFTACRSTTR